MIGLLLVAALQQAAPDTVTIDVTEALARGVDHSRVLSASRLRAAAARDRVGQAGAWPNPTVSVTAENVGQQVPFTGVEGVRGLEGQVVLSSGLPLGPERSGALLQARGLAAAAEASDEAALHGVHVDLLERFGSLLSAEAGVRSAAEEFATLDRLAEALAAQAREGRAADGDAARASLARGMAGTRLARREAAYGALQVDVARLVGLDPAVPLHLLAPSCAAAPRSASTGGGTSPPELRAAAARVDAARGATGIARGIRAPDLRTDIGLRRTGANTGLYLGLSAGLPFFDRGSRAISAARSEEDAAAAELDEVERIWSAERVARARALDALSRAGARFDAGWFDDLERTVEASAARFDSGEGTLLELLDSRRARLQALDDYHLWLAEWWAARVALDRARGHAPSADLLCTDPYRETP